MTESPGKHAGLYAAIAGSILVVLLTDLLFPLGYVFWVFYLVPVILRHKADVFFVLSEQRNQLTRRDRARSVAA